MTVARRAADLKKRTDDLKRVLRQPPAKDRVILERGAKHTKVIRKSDRMVITTLADTPSDYRSLRNTVAKLRKAHVFKIAPTEVQLKAIAMPWEDREDGMIILRRLGWEPGQQGRGGGPLRRFGEMVQEATLKTGLDKQKLARDAYTDPIRRGIIQGLNIDAYSVDKLICGIEYVKEQLGPEPVEEKVGLKKLADLVPSLSTGMHPDGTTIDVVLDPVEEPEVEYAQVGPLYQPTFDEVETLVVEYLEEAAVEKAPVNGKVNVDSLHIRVLVMLMRPEKYTQEERIALAVEVARAEGL